MAIVSLKFIKSGLFWKSSSTIYRDAVHKGAINGSTCARLAVTGTDSMSDEKMARNIQDHKQETAKRIAIFLDGTWNVTGDNTNVWRLKALCSSAGADGRIQRSYYAPSVNGFWGGVIDIGDQKSSHTMAAMPPLIDNGTAVKCGSVAFAIEIHYVTMRIRLRTGAETTHSVRDGYQTRAILSSSHCSARRCIATSLGSKRFA
jgi:hypothetical protein